MKHYIIPVFIPHLGCLQQCVFCNQKKITGRQTPVTAKQVGEIIYERLATIDQNRRIEVAFYGGSFTALPEEIQNELLAPAWQALQNGCIHAIRVSTRPDCISREIISNLLRHGVTTVELGVQSLDDHVLVSALRGHDSQAVTNAVKLLKMEGIQCGLQLMPGLPGEDWISLIETVRQTIELSPNFARIYPAIVIADTVLAELYNQGLYQPLSLKQAIVRSAYMKLLFERHNIDVIRTGLQASEDLDNKVDVVSGPYHSAFGELVDSHIFYLMLAGFIEQSSLHSETDFVIFHHPQDCSKVRGQYNSNINSLKQHYNLTSVKIYADSSVKKGCLLLKHQGQIYLFNKNMINCI